MATIRLAQFTAVVAVLCASALHAHAACYAAREQLAPRVITSFVDRPGELLKRNPDGGGALIARVRDLIASSPATLAPMIGLLAEANAEQARAIGTALAQASLICARTERPYASQMYLLLAGSGIKAAVEAYAGSMGYNPAVERDTADNNNPDEQSRPETAERDREASDIGGGALIGNGGGGTGGGSGGQTTSIGIQSGGAYSGSSSSGGSAPTQNSAVNYFTSGTNATSNLQQWRSSNSSNGVSSR